MATSIEIRRGDYAGAGVARTANADTRADITVIKLQVDSLQEAFTKDLIHIPVINRPDAPRINDLGRGKDDFTLKGTVTKAGSVDAVVIALDIRYAIQYWYQSGAITLVWQDEDNSAITMSYSGLLMRGYIQYTAGRVGQYPFSMQFAKGALTSG